MSFESEEKSDEVVGRPPWLCEIDGGYIGLSSSFSLAGLGDRDFRDFADFADPDELDDRNPSFFGGGGSGDGNIASPSLSFSGGLQSSNICIRTRSRMISESTGK